MLVLHGGWVPWEGLRVWGQTSEGPAPAERVVAALRTGASGHDVRTLRLPTRSGVLEPAPELDTLEPASRAALRLTPVAVPVVRVDDPSAALEALRADLPDGVVASTAWRVLAQVAAFADDLAARGRVAPFADRPTNSAGWLPVLTGADAAWARALALAVPPGLLAASSDAGADRGADLPDEVDAADVVADALDTLVDVAVRARLRHLPRRPPRTAWWRGLHDATGTLDLPLPPGVPQHLEDWLAGAFATSARARFRLTEPLDDDAQAWRLDVSLQSVEQPSVVVPAAQVWDGDHAALAPLGDAPAQSLLTELGRATRLVPTLEGALRTARPTGLDLDTDGAHAFLTRGAADLAAAGFGVDLPSWWGRASARVGLRLSAGTPAQPGLVAGTSRLGQAALVDYSWQVAVGDAVLTAEELEGLAQLQQPLVRLRGRWVELDTKRLRAGIELLTKCSGDDGAGRMTVTDLLSLLGEGRGPGGLPLVDVEAHGWLGDLLDGQARTLAPVAPPDGFTGTLRPYQERGLAWLAFLDEVGLGGVLADDMGLGKTVQLLALIARDAPHGTRGTDVGPTLLVCPMSLVGNWQREAAKFTPGLAVHVHHGADRARGAAFGAAVGASDLVVTTYAVLTRDVDALREIPWRRVVLDEAQAVKNAATKQSAAVRALPSRHRLAVTGTPVENRLADLWSIMDFANPGLLGTASRFKDRFAVPVERHQDEDAAARLRAVTQPFVLRRVKTDRSIIADLPDKLEMDVICTLTAEQAALYRAVVDDMLAKIEASEGIERRGLVLATMTKLKQVCNHPAQLLHDGSRIAGRSGKLARVEEILEEVLENGEKALLFTQFAEFGAVLRAHLSARFGREVLFLHGGVRKAERDAMVARFQDPTASGPPLFVLSLKAGGTGLTLTAANHVLHVDRWWNPAVEDQATDRAFRIGQSRTVQVRKLVCAGTLEERIGALIASKRELSQRIVGTGEGWLTELSTDALRDLIRLEAGAGFDE